MDGDDNQDKRMTCTVNLLVKKKSTTSAGNFPFSLFSFKLIKFMSAVKKTVKYM